MIFHDELRVILDWEEYRNYSSFHCDADADGLFSFFFLLINWNSSVKKSCALYPYLYLLYVHVSHSVVSNSLQGHGL